MRCNLDYLFMSGGLLEARGYRYPDDGSRPGTFELTDRRGSVLESRKETVACQDVKNAFGGSDPEALYGFYVSAVIPDDDVYLSFTGGDAAETARISLKKAHNKAFSPLRGILSKDKENFRKTRDFGTEKHPYDFYYRLYEQGTLLSAEDASNLMADACPEWTFLPDGNARFLSSLPDAVREAAAEHPESSVLYADYDTVTENGVHEQPVLFGVFDRVAARYGSRPGGFIAVKADRTGSLLLPDGRISLAALSDLSSSDPGSVLHVPGVLSSYPQGSTQKELVENDLPALGAADRDPLVSVIIPNRNEAEALCRAVRSLYTVSTYRAIETIIVENHSEDPETFAAYERLKTTYPNVRVITFKEPFNYSAINNFAAREARGKYLLLLNNDTEVISSDFLYQMVNAVREDTSVGAVGAKLLYRDGTVQHGGVLVGAESLIAHRFLGLPGDDPGYRGLAVIPSTVSAVTAACMLTKRSVYESVGGLTESLTVAYNDIDYCLKLEKAGWKTVFRPQALLYHDESRSRGYEDTDEKRARLQNERAELGRLHGERLCRDPYYPPLLEKIRDVDLFTGVIVR